MAMKMPVFNKTLTIINNTTMRKIFIFIIAFFATIASNAQNVYGFDINSTATKFRTHMKAKGYGPRETPSGADIYNVSFCGYKDVTCACNFDCGTDSIKFISFTFGNRDQKSKSDIYLNLRGQLSQMYDVKRDEDYNFISHSKDGMVSMYLSPSDGSLSLSFSRNRRYNGKNAIHKDLK